MTSKVRARPFALVALVAAIIPASGIAADMDRIRPYEANPSFWQYKGEPVLLLGGTWQDNLFNHPDGLEEHLDLLASVGGNYVRNVMSHRDAGNVFPYMSDAKGRFNLDEFNDEYWRRFDRFLQLTYDRDIIVQIEIWATWDHYEDAQSFGGWSKHPFNPQNNINYTPEQSGLPTRITYSPGPKPTGHPFFRSVPALDNNTLLLKYQRAYVDKLLSYSLKHPHVLYCMDNEIGEDLAWSDFWAQYIRSQAAEAHKQVETAEMRRNGNILAADHLHVINAPDLYTFLEISQNNTQRGQMHWNRIQDVRTLVRKQPRPINNTKIYTFDPDPNVAVRRWWRNILGGCASARFHRPHPLEGRGDHEKHSDVGLGLSPLAQAHILSARLVMNEIGWPDIEPDISFIEFFVNPDAKVTTEKTHVAYTRGNDGRVCIYLDGHEAASAVSGGDLSSWDRRMRLALANELTGDRGWRGVFHSVSIYNRALNPSEVADLFTSGAPLLAEGLQARYTFTEGDGLLIHDTSGHEPALNLYIEDKSAAAWRDDGLHVHSPVVIATQESAERLTAAIQNSNAFTIEAWITPAETAQTGPARIVTLSRDTSMRNFTLGQDNLVYEARLRTTAASANGLPALRTGPEPDASIAAARSYDRDCAAVFVTHGNPIMVDMGQLEEGLAAEWFDPAASRWVGAEQHVDGSYHPPSTQDWLLILKREEATP
jgi:hypothetical protein